jgi:antirestriction protein
MGLILRTLLKRLTNLSRYSVLPALTMDGIIYHHTTRGSFDGDSFQHFLAGLLKVMNPYPQERSVLVMDNCAIHHVEGVAELCAERCASTN